MRRKWVSVQPCIGYSRTDAKLSRWIQTHWPLLSSLNTTYIFSAGGMTHVDRLTCLQPKTRRSESSVMIPSTYPSRSRKQSCASAS